MGSVQAVIFDWGGVIMRTVDPAPRLYWDKRLGREPGSVERVVHGIDAWWEVQRGEISIDGYWKQVGQELGLLPDDLARLRHDFYSGDRIDRTLVALIERMRGGGILVGLLSNFSQDLVTVLDELGISPLFDAIVVSADIGAMKPDAHAYRAILDALGVLPAAAVFIDDSEQNVERARQIGIQAIHFVPGCDIEALLTQLLEDED